MATITVRDLPEDLVGRIKETAARNSRSMEQEVRQLLQERFARRQDLLARIRERPPDFPRVPASEIRKWIAAGRKARP